MNYSPISVKISELMKHSLFPVIFKDYDERQPNYSEHSVKSRNKA